MNEAIETTWEEYDQYMVQSGQWLTEDEFAWMMQQEELRHQYDYDYQEGC